MRVIDIINKDSSVDILQLQGEIENIDLFDGHFDKDKIELEFRTFILKGKKINKKYSVLEKIRNGDDIKINLISKNVDVYLFDKPPKYKTS